LGMDRMSYFMSALSWQAHSRQIASFTHPFTDFCRKTI
jgi:hypothetical protein